ncbi:hypothetical protein L227DRAFT_650111 [Lentinus tigrinus ALCF2SS1-6]|uniref:Uncharacterized protein n=1 Tax=Lentinus tigrinus ALCF2SS1-6 TaxID=1328759 RepID=A0A5C2SUL5_9APHY|nr:hypothetical protein L227DRAFT_650111 [Lentinus tigrinus ALCF2SS1-6]
MSQEPPAPFIKPDDFVRVKGRGKLYACKLCTPEGKAHGVPMYLAVALRHERKCEKHLEKVKEAAINDWDYEPVCDWGPPEMPKGTSAWEVSYPADRAEDFIHHWMDNVEAAERGEPMESMDSFIDRFNVKYAEWLKECERETEEWKKGQGDAHAEEEAPIEQCEGVQGKWYSGGSFDPQEDGFQPAEEAQDVWGPPPEDPYEAWGISRDEVTPWTNVPVPVSRHSDATAPKSPRNGYVGSRRSKNRGRGPRGGQKQAADGANRGTEGWRRQRAKIN